MKKSILSIIALFLFLTTEGQITLEHTYNVPPGKTLYYTDLGNNNYKYFFIDYYNNSFSLYNLDHTPFILNITPGISLDSAKFTIAYITNTLFDCDSTNIEYAITANGGSTVVDPFYIFRTDGTLLFQKDSVVTTWCFGCFGGVTVKPIFNTPEGAKLILANLTTNDWFIFSLCDLLPQTNINLENNPAVQFVSIYPNPSNRSMTIQVTVPDSYGEYELTVYNSSLQIIIKEKFNRAKSIFLNNEKMGSGTYFFSLQNSSKILQTGKFILTK